MPYLNYKNNSIYYTDTGKGRTIVLLHGFLENSSMWMDFESELNQRYRIVKLDLLGHGQTPCIGYVHTMEEMALAVKFVLDHLKLKKYVLVGHSMGGYVALAFAEENADNLLGLMLFYSTTKIDSPIKLLNRDRAIELAKKSHKTFIRESLPLLFRPKSRRMYKDQINALKREGLKTPQQGVIAAIEGMKLRLDHEALLHFAPYPFAMVTGKHDPALDFEAQLEQHQAEKVIQVTITENGHMGHIEDRDICLEAIKSFVKKV